MKLDVVLDLCDICPLSQKDTKHGEMILGCTNNRVSYRGFHWTFVSTLTKGVTDVYTHENLDTMILL